MEDRKRSKPSPLSTPSEAFEHIRSIARELGSGPFKREDAVKAMGYQMVSGTAARRFSALGMYGLIDGRGDAYHLTALGKRVFRPLPDEEETLKKEAFLAVEIYRAVLDEYSAEGSFPNSLSIILERRFGIAAGSGDLVAKVFRQSALEAAIIDEGGRIVQSETNGPLVNPETAPIGTTDPVVPMGVPIAAITATSVQPGSVIHSLPRSGVTFTHPERISQKDIDRIAKWLDLVVKPALEFAIEETESGTHEPD